MGWTHAKRGEAHHQSFARQSQPNHCGSEFLQIVSKATEHFETEMTAGTRLLLLLTTIVCAIACAMAAYVLGTNQVLSMEQLGFVPWADSSTTNDVFFGLWTAPLPGSAWYHLTSGQSLSFAFVQSPKIRAILAGIGMIIAGSCAIILSFQKPFISQQSLQNVQSFKGRGFIVIVVILVYHLAISVYNIIPHQISGFDIDLKQGIISDAVTHPGKTLPMTHQTYFDIHHSAYAPHSSSYYYETAANESGQAITLFRVGDFWEAQSLQSAISNFINSSGWHI
jgi:hypothetical protein